MSDSRNIRDVEIVPFHLTDYAMYRTLLQFGDFVHGATDDEYAHVLGVEEDSGPDGKWGKKD